MEKHLKVILIAVVSLLTGLIVGRLWPRLAPTTQQDPEYDPFTKYYRNPYPTDDHPLTEYPTGDPPTYYTGDSHPTVDGTHTVLNGGVTC